MDSAVMLLSMVSASGGEVVIIDKNHPRPLKLFDAKMPPLPQSNIKRTVSCLNS